MPVASARVVAVGLAVVVPVALTACGGDDEEPVSPAAPLAQIATDQQAAPAENGIDELAPDEVLETAIANLEEAGSYRVSGTTSAGSTIDIAFEAGAGSMGTVTTGSEVRLVSVDGVVYITSDPETLADLVDADIDDTIAGKWLTIPADSESGYELFAEGDAFAQTVLGSQVEGELTSVQEVDGTPAVGLMFAESGGTLWVSATGEPLPLRFEEKGASGGSGVLRFADFGDEVDVATPDEDDVVDPAELPSDD